MPRRRTKMRAAESDDQAVFTYFIQKELAPTPMRILIFLILHAFGFEYHDTLYPEIFLDSCEQQEAALKALVSSNSECNASKKWRNFKRLRRIPCEKSDDGTIIDPDGIGQLNCVAELERQGTTVSKVEIGLYCQQYLKLKCEKSLP